MANKRDYTSLLGSYKGESWLREMRSRARSRTMRNRPLTVQERFYWFRQMSFNPWGLYMPERAELADYARRHVRELGDIANQDERWGAYQQFQIETEQWQLDGEAGAWTGQQALARDTHRYRIAGQGRRSGKTTYAVHEGIAVAKARPRSTIWVCAPYMDHVERAFDILVSIVKDLRWETVAFRNSAHEKLIVLDNGSRFQGLSLENYKSAAGASVNFLILDEAAQVSSEAWTRALLPPMADALGHAILITSYEGQQGFFYEQMEETRKEGGDDWAAFHGVTWDNFYAFEKGIDSEAIQSIKRTTPPVDFLEQYGAIPAGARDLVYPTFRAPVHAGHYPFDPDRAVRLAVDPSYGANAYAALALQWDHRDTWAIDEIYALGATAEEMHRAVRRKPWAENLNEVLMDNADPNEILRWCEAGFNAFAIPDKPKVEERYPVVQRMLRDPVLYWPFYESKVTQVLATRGLTPEAFKALPMKEQRPLYIDVEELLTDLHLAPDDILALRKCARFFVNEQTCPNLINEFQKYSFARHRNDNLNKAERGRKYLDHLLDALGYFAWVYWRADWVTAGSPNLNALGLGLDLSFIPEVPVTTLPTPLRKPDTQVERMASFVRMTREQFAPVKIHSMVEERWD